MTSASRLFSPFRLRDLELANRLVISPMCQYSATDGCANDWHLIHLGSLAQSGAGLLILEATAVEAAGRITPNCLGLWDDVTEAALGRVIGSVRRWSRMPLAIQLCHAGRKAAAHTPFAGGGRPLGAHEGAWPVIGPSAVPFDAGWQTPAAATEADMDRIVAAFVDSARRAHRLGFDALELHAAHGYLLSAFLSPIANRRDDAYGGSLAHRMRFPLRVVAAVREAWADRPLGVRINGTDWHPEGITVDEAASFALELARVGVDFVDVSGGGNVITRVPLGPGYQVPLAEAVRARSGLPTIAVGLIKEPAQAEAVIAEDRADLVAIGRAVLNHPHWPWLAAEVLGARVEVPPQYGRAATRAGTPPPYAR